MFKTNLLFLCLSFSTVLSFSQDKPNVILIMVDDMNDWVGAFGGNPQAITPNMDAFAKKSMVFKNAYCSAPLCNPSRTSILTGYNPSTTGVYGNTEHFRDKKGLENTITLPQYFNQNGYTTAAAGKIFHSPRGPSKKPRPKSDPGSFEMEHKGGLGSTYPKDEERFQHGLDFSFYKDGSHMKRSFDWKGVEVENEETSDWKSADYCVKFLEEDHSKPFFLACGIFRPHLPWYAPQKYFDLYNVDNITLPEVIANDLDDVGSIASNSVQKKLHKQLVEKKKWKEAVRAYLANLSYADACVGHLIDAFENSKYKQNTIVVLMGDHGWHLGEKEHWTKQTLWEEAAKTPLLIYNPNTSAKGISTKIVSLIDVYPTLLDLCDLPQKEDLDGKSIAQLLANPDTNWDEIALTSKGNGTHSLRDQNYRYTVYPNGFEELYDHRIDPMEWNNIANSISQKEVLIKFRKELQHILK
ncbi:sulfatase [Algibacter lectus]|uniref:sulfatase n=1 Tax=Algibacter lectus TaxID=221126 RepID=UPI0026EDFFDB|nr:sulfatase [Algibacter lectus]MDO7136012.1 sulfatase [Algibacter lectus]